MEINSRLWGSLKLSSFSGIDFVKLLLSKKLILRSIIITYPIDMQDFLQLILNDG